MRPFIPWHEREHIYYLGEMYPLHIEALPLAKKKGACELLGEKLLLTIPQELNTSEKKKSILFLLEEWYRRQAHKILSERTDYFSSLMQVNPKRIIIKTQRRRWGSCDRENTIRYNWKIIMMALPLVDYLVVHELAHIRVKNHSAHFWNFVASILPDHRQRRQQLRYFSESYEII